jgi:hypothetical protein
MNTYKVVVKGGNTPVVEIQAGYFKIDHGVLVFYDADNYAISAIAQGEWMEVYEKREGG